MYVNRKAYANFNIVILYYHYLIRANLFKEHLHRRVTEKYYTMKKLTLKLQGTATNIGFTNKAIHNQIIPKFTQVKEQFINNNDKHDSKTKILHSHLLENKKNLSSLMATEM